MPLIAWNLLTDIAVLGPVQLDSPPATPPLDTSTILPVGADLFAIGYPGKVEPFPQPTIAIDDPGGAVGGYTLSIERRNGHD